ncbi:MAG TPA: hypothetical protein VM532_02030 [Burkholderiales bacterium]|nr:hypothetical protein [Burkholderiales bacterium]
MYKIQVQEENGAWRNVDDPNGAPLTFRDKSQARAKLEELYPVLVKMEKYAMPKRTRVVAMWDEEEGEEEDGDGDENESR